MNKIILVALMSLILTSCASNSKKNSDKTKKEYIENIVCPPGQKASGNEFPDTTDCMLDVSIPDNFIKKEELEKKWIKIDTIKGLEFNFGINQGHYWVKIQELQSRVHPDSEVVLQVKSKGDSNVESINLVKINTNSFQGFGFRRHGPSNFILIYRTPGQKEIVFDFDLDITN